VLILKPRFPLQRFTEYIIKFPRAAIRYDPRANPAVVKQVWKGFPTDKWGDYSFTTGTPDSSNTKLSVVVGCDDKADCDIKQKRLDDDMNCLMEMCTCRMYIWRCKDATMSTRAVNCHEEVVQKHCRAGCIPYGIWAAPIAVRRLAESSAASISFLGVNSSSIVENAEEERRRAPGVYELPPSSSEDERRLLGETPEEEIPEPIHVPLRRLGVKGGGMAAMKGEPVTVKVTILTHIAPWWIYICPILSTICSAFALNRGAAWFIDMFVAARKYDRTLMRLRRLMPFAASSLAILMPAIGTLIV